MSEKRSLLPIQKALAIKHEHRCTEEQLTKVCNVSKGALYRAEKSLKAGREVGRVGRPPVLTREEESILVEMIADSCRKGAPTTSPGVCDMVFRQKMPIPPPSLPLNLSQALSIKKSENPDLDEVSLRSKLTQNWCQSYEKT